jgi:hypothetical protein
VAKKHAGGRPTKYEGQATIDKVAAAANLLRTNPESFLSGCGVEQVADALGVCTDTVYEWKGKHPEFSDSIKSWTTARDAAFYKLAKTLPPAIWIFMAKNFMGWRDVQAVEHSGAIKTDPLIVKVVFVKDAGKPGNGNGNGGNGHKGQ